VPYVACFDVLFIVLTSLQHNIGFGHLYAERPVLRKNKLHESRQAMQISWSDAFLDWCWRWWWFSIRYCL